MQPVREYQQGGVLDASFYGFDPEEYEPLTQEEYDQQEADYYGISVDELRNFRQQQVGIGALPAAQETAGDAPYVASATTSTTSRDPALQQLLFGLDGEGGFIPGAMRAAERTFFDEEGRPVIVPQEVAGLTPDQLAAAQQARDLIGVQDRFISDAESAYRAGIDQLGAGQEAARDFGMRGLEAVQRGVSEEERLRRSGLEGLLGSLGEGRRLSTAATEDLGTRLAETTGIQRGAVDEFGRRLGEVESIGARVYDDFGRDITGSVDAARGAVGRFGDVAGEAEGIQRGATGRFGRAAGDIARRQIGATEGFGGALGESERLLRGTTGAYDQDLTQQFMDPFEDAVVQQTVEDAVKQANLADIAQTARDIRSGGESAFGSRARLSADERTEALGRGLAKEIAGIRSRGFSEAQRAGLGEFARQQQAARAAASGLSGLAGQRLGSQQALGSTLRGVASDVLGAERGLASGLGSLGAQKLGAETNLASRLGQVAGQRLQAGQGLGQLLSATGSQKLGSQQQLASGLGQTAQQLYGAGTGLGRTLVGFGQTGQQAQAGAGQAALGAGRQLSGALGQMGGLESQIGQQRFQAQQGLGGFLQGLGGQAQQAGMAGVNLLSGIGGQQQALQQQILNAQRANALQAQQAPLQQYQALLPFIGTAAQTAGQQSSVQNFTPPPSPLQAGLGVGLSALGGIGSFLNPGTQRAV